MKKFRNLFGAATLIAVLTFGNTFANAGLLISDFSGGDTQTCDTEAGILDTVLDFTGVVIRDLTGVVIRDASEPTTQCGVVIRD